MASSSHLSCARCRGSGEPGNETMQDIISLTSHFVVCNTDLRLSIVSIMLHSCHYHCVHVSCSTQQGKDSELVVHGVYGMVRHPMYTGVLMMLWSQTVMVRLVPVQLYCL